MRSALALVTLVCFACGTPIVPNNKTDGGTEVQPSAMVEFTPQLK